MGILQDRANPSLRVGSTRSGHVLMCDRGKPSNPCLERTGHSTDRLGRGVRSAGRSTTVRWAANPAANAFPHCVLACLREGFVIVAVSPYKYPV
jgi:hypothetical protein